MNALLARETENILQDAAEMLSQDAEKFRVTNLEQATWAMRKLRALAEKENEIRKIADAEIKRVNDWLMSEAKEIEGSRSFFVGLLESYHRQTIEADPKAKTIKTPYGKLKLTKQQPDYKRDDNMLLNWAKVNKPDILVQQDPKLDWAGLKKQIKVVGEQAIDQITGECIPGIIVTEREAKFTIEVD